jgi:hypothetical protein
MNSTLAEVEREALTLPAEDRARLADKLWHSLADRSGREVEMSPELARLLDEGLADLSLAKTTDELRRQ